MKTIEQHIETLQNSNLEHPHRSKIVFQGLCGMYHILGSLPTDLGTLRVTIQLTPMDTVKTLTAKVNLYISVQVHELIQLWNSSGAAFEILQLEADLIVLTSLLQKYRETKLFPKILGSNARPKDLDFKVEKTIHQTLKRVGLVKRIDTLLEQLGVVGNEQSKSRLLTFLIAVSYKTKYPLHGIIQSTTGSGKSFLINTIAECMPKEDVMSFTRVSSKSLYHYSEGELENKLLLIQDLDGLDDESMYAFRELQSAGSISTSLTVKDPFGELVTMVKSVNAHFSSLGATTKEVYSDNVSRSILIPIDESEKQTDRIIREQNKVIAGTVNQPKRQKAKEQLCNMVRVLQPIGAVNPFAEQLTLPKQARMRRRLNLQFQHLILVITWLNQLQREKNEQGNILSTIPDIEVAIDLFFDSIILKVDDIDSSTRQFYERLKTAKHQDEEFTQKEVRRVLNLSKTHTSRCLKKLVEYEYIRIESGSVNKGFQYGFNAWDDPKSVNTSIRKQLTKQVEKIKSSST